MLGCDYADYASNGPKWPGNERILIKIAPNTIAPRALVTPLFGPNPKIIRIVWEKDLSTFARMGLKSSKKIAIHSSFGFLEPFLGEKI